MSKHTPGPWTAIPRMSIGERPIIDEAGDTLAYVCGETTVKSIRDANAALIAAAPDLLAACEAAVIDGVCFCEDRIACGGVAPCWQCRARTAIAKAEGTDK